MKLPTLAPEFPPLLRRVALILLAMMAGSLVFTVLMTWLLHRPYPFGVVWISGEEQWCDFRVFQERSVQFRTAAYWLDYDYPMTYPAAVAVVLAMFYKLPHPLRIYLAILFAGCIWWAMWFARGLVQRGIPATQAGAFALVILLTTWPVLYEFDTANIEGMMAMLLFVGVLAVLHGGTGGVVVDRSFADRGGRRDEDVSRHPVCVAALQATLQGVRLRSGPDGPAQLWQSGDRWTHRVLAQRQQGRGP